MEEVIAPPRDWQPWMDAPDQSPKEPNPQPEREGLWVIIRYDNGISVIDCPLAGIENASPS